MKKFDGVLILSDWDGTLCYNGNVSDENVKAIKYFQENGGSFTVSSGRNISFIDESAKKFRPNTYVSSLNGAYVAHLDTGEVLYQKACDSRLLDIINGLYRDEEFDRLYLYTTDEPQSQLYSKEEYYSNLERIKEKAYYKALICIKNDDNVDADAVAKRVVEHTTEDYVATRSYRIGVEILKRESTKGAALINIAKKIGARLTVAVGDYENDISMIRAADIGYAVANAQDIVKSVADRITVSCADSAIARIIRDIEHDVLPKLK